MKTWNAFIKKIPLLYQNEDKEEHVASEYVPILSHP